MSANKTLLAALFAAVALAALALVVPFDAPGLGREVEARVRSATGITLEVSRSRIRLFRGLLLEDVRATAGGYNFRAPRLTLDNRPLALLRGRWELTGIRLDTARVEAVSIEGLGLALSRLDYDARAITPLHGLRSEGVLAIRKIAFEGRELRDLAARVGIEGGRVRIEDVRFESARGALSGELALDFNSFPFRYRAELVGPSFELEGVGRGTLRLEAQGFGTKARDLKGKGAFELERGRLPDAHWIREIDPELVGAEHAPAEIPFDVRDGRVYFDGFELEATGKILEVEGSFGLDGAGDLRATVKSRRD